MKKLFKKYKKICLWLIIISLALFFLSFKQARAGSNNQDFLDSIFAKDSFYYIYNSEIVVSQPNFQTTSYSAHSARKRYTGSFDTFETFIPNEDGVYVCAVSIGTSGIDLDTEASKLNGETADWWFLGDGNSVIVWENPLEGQRNVELIFDGYTSLYSYYVCDFIPEVQASNFLYGEIVGNTSWGTDYNSLYEEKYYRHSWFTHNYPHHVEGNPTHFLTFGGVMQVTDIPKTSITELWSNMPLDHFSFTSIPNYRMSTWLVDMSKYSSSFVHNLGVVSNNQFWSNFERMFFGWSSHFKIWLNIPEDTGGGGGYYEPDDWIHHNMPSVNQIPVGNTIIFSYNYDVCESYYNVYSGEGEPFEVHLFDYNSSQDIKTLPLSMADNGCSGVGVFSLERYYPSTVFGKLVISAYGIDHIASSNNLNINWYLEEGQDEFDYISPLNPYGGVNNIIRAKIEDTTIDIHFEYSFCINSELDFEENDYKVCIENREENMNKTGWCSSVLEACSGTDIIPDFYISLFPSSKRYGFGLYDDENNRLFRSENDFIFIVEEEISHDDDSSDNWLIQQVRFLFNRLKGVFPFNILTGFLNSWTSAVYQVGSIFEIKTAYAQGDFNVDGLDFPESGEGFKVISIDDFASTGQAMELTLFKKADMENFIGADFINLMRSLLTMGLWISFFLYLFFRIKNFDI